MSDLAKKASPPKDWHTADIKAALDKAGWSFNALGIEHGYTSKSALAHALHEPYPRAEKIIADALGLKPWVIWPSRYSNGLPNRTPGRKPKRPAHLQLVKPTTARAVRNPQTRRTA